MKNVWGVVNANGVVVNNIGQLMLYVSKEQALNEAKKLRENGLMIGEMEPIYRASHGASQNVR